MKQQSHKKRRRRIHYTYPRLRMAIILKTWRLISHAVCGERGNGNGNNRRPSSATYRFVLLLLLREVPTRREEEVLGLVGMCASGKREGARGGSKVCQSRQATMKMEGRGRRALLIVSLFATQATGRRRGGGGGKIRERRQNSSPPLLPSSFLHSMCCTWYSRPPTPLPSPAKTRGREKKTFSKSFPCLHQEEGEGRGGRAGETVPVKEEGGGGERETCLLLLLLSSSSLQVVKAASLLCKEEEEEERERATCLPLLSPSSKKADSTFSLPLPSRIFFSPQGNEGNGNVGSSSSRNRLPPLPPLSPLSPLSRSFAPAEATFLFPSSSSFSLFFATQTHR